MLTHPPAPAQKPPPGTPSLRGGGSAGPEASAQRPVSDVTHPGAGAGWGLLRGRPAGGVSALLPRPGSPKRDFSHVRPWYDLSSWVSVSCSVLTSGAWFDIGAGFYARSPSCIFRAPLLCQVPSFRHKVSFYVRCPEVYIKYPSLLSGSRFSSDTRLLRQTPRFTSGTRFYVRRPGLHQAPSFTSDAQVCQTPSFYVRHPVLHQAPRLTSGAGFHVRRLVLVRRPGLRQAPSFYVTRQGSALGAHIRCWAFTPEAMSGAQVYVRSPVF